MLVDEHSSSEDLPYKFNGKQFDEETGLYYYGARYLNPMTSLWYGVDPLAEKYVTTSGYIHTLDNPIKLVDTDGQDFVSAITEGVGTFVFSAGASFVQNLLNNGGNVQRAYSQIDWEGAGKDAVVAGVMSLVVSGASTTKLIKKLSSIKVGNSTLAKILVNTAVNMVTNITADAWKEKSLSDVDFKDAFFSALAGSLAEAGLGKLSKKLEDSFSNAKKVVEDAKVTLNRHKAHRGSNFMRQKYEANLKKATTHASSMRRRVYTRRFFNSIGTNAGSRAGSLIYKKFKK